MSSALYATRLIWDGRQGIAKLHGNVIRLQQRPVISDLEFEAIDCIPEIALYLIRPPHGRERDMTPAEIRTADAFLLATFKV